MKYLNVVIIIFLTIILTPNIETKEKHKEVDGIHRYIMGDNRSDTDISRVFVPGVSNNQIAIEEAEAERERERLEELNRVRQASYTSSFTGQGSDIEVVGTSWEQCVIYAKRQTGISRSLGYAGKIPPQGQEAKVGAIALEWNHASVVIADYGSAIRVRESNWWRGAITERTIPKNKVRGYIYS